MQNRIFGGHARLRGANTLSLQIVMLMQPTLAPVDQFSNLASIINELQEDDCGEYVEHLKKNLEDTQVWFNDRCKVRPQM